jgi:hypothetical protein
MLIEAAIDSLHLSRRVRVHHAIATDKKTNNRRVAEQLYGHGSAVCR